MAITLLTEANLSFFKKELRKANPEIRSCHLTEAIASALGFNTHNALLAEIKHHPRHVPAVSEVSDKRLHQRIQTLCSYPAHSVGSLEVVARNADVPDQPWVHLNESDVDAKNAWFKACDTKCRPYIYISHKTKYWRLDWDCITYGGVPSGEKIWEVAKRTSADDKDAVKFFWNEFVRVCKGSPAGRQQQVFDGNFFTGSVKYLSREQAMELVDVYFKRLYALVQQFPPNSSR